MIELFDDFFDNELLGFAKPSKIVFNTNGIKDMIPIKWSKTEYGYKAIVKTLGIEAVNVETKSKGIRVFGENEIDGQKYDTTIDLPIAEKVMDTVLKIKHRTVAGITIIELIVDKPKRRNIEIIKG